MHPLDTPQPRKLLETRSLLRAAVRLSLVLVPIEDAGLVFCRGGEAFQALYRPQAEALAELLADVTPGDPRLLLAHHPDFSEMLPPARVDLMLAGHTHGGYVRLPLIDTMTSPSCFGNSLELPRRWASLREQPDKKAKIG